MDFKSLREKTITRVKALGYSTNRSLPLLTPDVSLRPKVDIENRALTLAGVVAVSCGFSASQLSEWLLREQLSKELTPKEKVFVRERKGDARTFQQQVEALCIFAWCFQKVDDVDLLRPCNDNLVTLYPDLNSQEPSANWRSSNRLRSEVEILEFLDCAYCLHWALRQAEVDGTSNARTMQALSIVVERRRALEWALGDAQWDGVPLDT